MSRPRSELELLLVDGNNLLHRVSGGVGEPARQPLLARLRTTLPGVTKIVVLDGHRPTDRPHQAADRWLEVRHAGGSADDHIVAHVRGLPDGMRARTVVVTDDRALTERARSAGAGTQRLDWLVGLLDLPGRATGIAPGRPPRPAADTDEERPAWQPGRGATRKRGNPRRAPRRRRAGA